MKAEKEKMLEEKMKQIEDVEMRNKKIKQLHSELSEKAKRILDLEMRLDSSEPSSPANKKLKSNVRSMSIEVTNVERSQWRTIKSQSFEMPELKSETKLPRPSFKKLNSDITEINEEKKLQSAEANTGPEFNDKKTHTRIVEASCPEEESDGSP